MAKPKNTRRRHYSVAAAIALHAEANKSDPFAAKRMGMTLARHPRETKHVGEEAVRLNDARTSRIKRRSVADWVSREQAVALNGMYADMRNSKQYKRAA